MCGIAGIYSLEGKPINLKALGAMSRLLEHRGPDGQGYLLADTSKGKLEFCADESRLESCGLSGVNLGLSHRRLSIIDLSRLAAQPMPSEDGSIWIIFNGEIFNYVELRAELTGMGYKFRSSSDTEVILRAYEHFGFDCVRRFNGMWSFAIWDSKKCILFCSRDRFGIKPFYYYREKGLFLFASEIKSLLLTRRASPNDRAVFNYLVRSFGFVDGTEETFFRDIFQLLPGHNLIIGADTFRISRYWNIDDVREKPFAFSLERAIEEYSGLFTDAVKIRMRSDVKVAGALSGGLDSSSITCVIKKRLKIDNYRTYSACFDDPRFDEREYIECVAKDTGFESNYVFPDRDSLLDIIKKQIWIQDEPFNAMWVHSQWFVYAKARLDGVKVFLNGHGGDESLAGYYPHFDALWAGFLIKGRLVKLWEEVTAFKKKNPQRAVSPARLARHIFNRYLPRKVKDLFGPRGRFLCHSFRRSASASLYRFSNNFGDLLNRYLYESLFISPIRGMLHFDDRNSMAFSIEARIPFLDYRLIEFAFRIPGEYKIRSGVNKYILREGMKDVLPPPIYNRYGKKGFSSAAPQWFRDKRHELDDLFNSPEFRRRGYFNQPEVMKKIDAHCSGGMDFHEQIASWLTLELWFRKFIDGANSGKVESAVLN